MKIRKIILFVFVILLIPTMVKASCDYKEKNRLQFLASNLSFTYNYIEKENSVDFSITVTNLHPELYVIDQENIKIYYYNKNKEVTINNYKSGDVIKFIVYGNSGNCKNVELLNNIITLPSYNKFYKDPVCEGVTDYKLCDRWTMMNLSYDDFVQNVQRHKEQSKVDVPIILKKKDFIEIIINFLSKYSFYMFGGIIVICCGLILYLSHKDDFDLG